MRIAALVIGIIGGLFGILASILALVIGGVSMTFATSGGGTVTTLGFVALFLSLVGFVGAGLAMAKPRAAAVILLVTGIGMIIAISLFGLIAAPLFFISALFAFLGRRKRPRGAAAVEVSR